MLHGEPNITWKTSEYAIIGKFSYGKPDIVELRKTIPGQCGIKSECTIGVLDSRHILIRLTSLEDYVQLLSAATFYNPWFEPDVETSIGVAWISFPELPPNFFAKKAIFSIATAVSTPLTVDIAMKNQTRPNCARIKVEVDLTAKLPQRVRITEKDDHTGAIKYKWIKVQYDYMPKYCKECCLQGHDEHSCWVLNPELYDTKSNDKKGDRTITKTRTNGEPYRVLTSGKVIGKRQHKQEWMVRKRNKYKGDKYGHIKGVNEVHIENSFDTLETLEGEIHEPKREEEEIKNKEKSTKE
ncbi:hypothetical protein H5410_018204 [Solanum commersonii]|uniref:DUF4283 domain-containing protein n=1 Tax=Solanum commersonii TaxID=4109 RepID=A0A9J6A2G4_SOLCO|nr:hypothetical protein H5410_018204 [Solanum commersonii]